MCCHFVQAKEEGKDTADKVEPVMRTNSKSSQEWQVQNDSKPLWTKSPREVSTSITTFNALAVTVGGTGIGTKYNVLQHSKLMSMWRTAALALAVSLNSNRAKCRLQEDSVLHTAMPNPVTAKG